MEIEKTTGQALIDTIHRILLFNIYISEWKCYSHKLTDIIIKMILIFRRDEDGGLHSEICKAEYLLGLNRKGEFPERRSFLEKRRSISGIC